MHSEAIPYDDEDWSVQLQDLLRQQPSLRFDDLVETIGPQVPVCIAARHWHSRRGDEFGNEFGTEQQRLRLLLGDALAQLGAVAAPLARHAEEIQRQFSRLDAAVHEVVGLRVATGRALIVARAAVDAEHGPGNWQDWCKENVRRSQGDIRKLMKLAGADDAEAAVAEEREKARVGMARHRANVSAVEQRVDVPSSETPPRSEPPKLRLVEPSVEPSPDDIAFRVELFLLTVLQPWAVDAAADAGMSCAAWIINQIEQAKERAA